MTPAFRHAFVLPALVIAFTTATSSCATTRIPNTDVADTRENRDAIDFSERYRRAVEQRDTRTLLALASQRYFEDGGTPQGDDDYGYEGLRRLLGIWADEVREIRYEIRYRRVTFEREGQRALVEYTYTGSYTLRRAASLVEDRVPVSSSRPASSVLSADPVRGATATTNDQDVWYRRVADNRLEFERENGEWRIIAGM